MDDSLYRTFFDVEERHWWFVGRQRIVRRILEDTGLRAGGTVLDVGCGTGAFLKSLEADFDVYGTDTSELAIAYCRKRGLRNVFQCTLDEFPREDMRFNLITLLDVIEHVDEDVALLKKAGSMLKSGGSIVITVPAYQFLWSRHDEVNRHKRRYSRKLLSESVVRAGLTLRKISYFNTILFPAALIQRIASKFSDSESDSTLSVPARPVNTLLREVFAAERIVLSSLPLPFGLSILAVAD